MTELGLCLATSLQVQTLRSWLDNLNLGICGRKKAVFFDVFCVRFSLVQVPQRLRSIDCVGKWQLHREKHKNVELQPSSTLAYHIRQIAKAVVIGFLVKAHKAA